MDAIFEGRLTGLLGIDKYCLVDMDHDLVPLAGATGVERVVQSRLGNEADRVGLPLARGRWIALRIVHPGLGIQLVRRGLECAAEYGADLGGEAASPGRAGCTTQRAPPRFQPSRAPRLVAYMRRIS